jgi:hypothetical protein
VKSLFHVAKSTTLYLTLGFVGRHDLLITEVIGLDVRTHPQGVIPELN